MVRLDRPSLSPPIPQCTHSLVVHFCSKLYTPCCSRWFEKVVLPRCLCTSSGWNLVEPSRTTGLQAEEGLYRFCNRRSVWFASPEPHSAHPSHSARSALSCTSVVNSTHPAAHGGSRRFDEPPRTTLLLGEAGLQGSCE